jgi:purine-binding chemotaxis protein CheW
VDKRDIPEIDNQAETDSLGGPSRSPRGEAAGESVQLVSFKLADEEYAVEIHHLQEIIRLLKITPVPQVPDFVLGIINIRGELIPVFDLRKKFGLAESAPTTQTKIVIVRAAEAVISFIVDKVIDTIKIDRRHIDPSPNVKMEMERDCVSGVGILDKRMVIVLDIEKVHSHINEAIKSFKL